MLTARLGEQGGVPAKKPGMVESGIEHDEEQRRVAYQGSVSYCVNVLGSSLQQSESAMEMQFESDGDLPPDMVVLLEKLMGHESRESKDREALEHHKQQVAKLQPQLMESEAKGMALLSELDSFLTPAQRQAMSNHQQEYANQHAPSSGSGSSGGAPGNGNLNGSRGSFASGGGIPIVKQQFSPHHAGLPHSFPGGMPNFSLPSPMALGGVPVNAVPLNGQRHSAANTEAHSWDDLECAQGILQMNMSPKVVGLPGPN